MGRSWNYFITSVCDPPNKEVAPHLENPPLLAISGHIGKARIIDYLHCLIVLALYLKEYL